MNKKVSYVGALALLFFGVMVEEWLFWDNAMYMKQIGIGN
jgi:hypothetical protein